MTNHPPLAVRLLICGLLACIVPAAGCAMTQDSIMNAKTDSAKTDTAGDTGSSLVPVWSLQYTGAERTVIVPEGVTWVQVNLTGGAGGGNGRGGRGSTLTANVPVEAGATLGISVGGLGQDNKGSKSPGGGGWGLVAGGIDLSGGPGGHGYSLGVDGSGGGGGSALRVNGVVKVIAGGGGGSVDAYAKGYGSGGFPAGESGLPKAGGPGGSVSNPHLVSAGADGNRGWSGDADAGAGGGGGYYNGGGGKANGNGGGGAGYAAQSVTIVSSTTGTTVAAGSASLAWGPGAPALQQGVSYEIRKAGAPTEQLLEVKEASTRDGAEVDTYGRVRGDGTSAQSNELWRFVPDPAGSGFGQLVNAGTSKCLERNDDSGLVDQWRCDAADGEPGDRLWKPVENGTGGTAFMNKTTTTFLATTAASGNVTDLSKLQLAAEQSDRSSWLVYRSTPS